MSIRRLSEGERRQVADAIDTLIEVVEAGIVISKPHHFYRGKESRLTPEDLALLRAVVHGRLENMKMVAACLMVPSKAEIAFDERVERQAAELKRITPEIRNKIKQRGMSLQPMWRDANNDEVRSARVSACGRCVGKRVYVDVKFFGKGAWEVADEMLAAYETQDVQLTLKDMSPNEASVKVYGYKEEESDGE